MLNAILFDLDATLLPFWQEEFIAAYFTLLGKKVQEHGYPADKTLAALLRGTQQMITNDGSVYNRDRVWDSFSAEVGEEARALEPILDQFYQEEFHGVQSVLRERVNRRPLIDSLRARGYTVALATSPLFPHAALVTRLSWIGLAPEDFNHATTYENSRFTKPNPGYYKEVLDAIQKSPEECLMVGNHAVEDAAAAKTGIGVYVITDYLENPDNRPLDGIPHGTFQDFSIFAQTLPQV